ncbi:DUF4870 domain-containing protein [Clostridium sp. DL1XJH146]
MEKENEQVNENVMNTTDAVDNKWVSVLAYFLFFLPLIIAKDSEFGKFHANQGLNLLLLGIAVSVVGTIIPIIGWFIIIPVGCILCLVFGIMGIVNAINGKMKELPLIGRIKLIK